MAILSSLLRAALLWVELRNAAEFARQKKIILDEIRQLTLEHDRMRGSGLLSDQHLATDLVHRIQAAKAAADALSARYVELARGPAGADDGRDLRPGARGAVVLDGGGEAPGDGTPELRRALPV